MEQHSVLPRNPDEMIKPEERAPALLQEMTLEEKSAR